MTTMSTHAKNNNQTQWALLESFACGNIGTTATSGCGLIAATIQVRIRKNFLCYAASIFYCIIQFIGQTIRVRGAFAALPT